MQACCFRFYFLFVTVIIFRTMVDSSKVAREIAKTLGIMKNFSKKTDRARQLRSDDLSMQQREESYYCELTLD